MTPLYSGTPFGTSILAEAEFGFIPKWKGRRGLFDSLILGALLFNLLRKRQLFPMNEEKISIFLALASLAWILQKFLTQFGKF